MPALLFGSISTLVDTSELQRQAFNDAFAANGLDWEWSQDDYRALIEKSGGEQRIAEQATSSGEDVDAKAVHQAKSELFRTSLAGSDLGPRPGVVETIKAGKDQGFKIALVTTTSKENVDALVEALAPDVQRDDFDLIVNASDVDQPKPDDAAFRYALDTLGETVDTCVAIEDNLGGVQAAKAAGLTCAAFPNENTSVHDFHAADRRVDDELRFAELQTLIPNA